MNLLLFLLKSNQTLISLSDELDYEPKCHLMQPHEVTGKTKITLTPWPQHTEDTDILLSSDSLLTVVEPTKKLADAYLKKIGKTYEDLKPKDNKVLLTEDENVPQAAVPPEDEDEYEPYYMETE